MTRRPTWRRPISFTALLPVLHDAEGLARELGNRGDTVEATGLGAMAALHFFRLQLLLDGEQARLLFGMVSDGPVDHDLREVLRVTADWLPELLMRHCGIPASADLPARLAEGMLSENTLYLGCPGASARQVREEAHLREVVQAYLDDRWTHAPWPAGTPSETIRAEIRGHVLELGDARLPKAQLPPPPLAERVSQWFDMGIQIASPLSGVLHREVRTWLERKVARRSALLRAVSQAALAVHWAYTRPATWLFLVGVRWLEHSQADPPVAPSPGHVESVVRREEHQVQNPLTMYSVVRAGPLRRWALKRVLIGAEAASRHLWNEGSLAGISTIHAARVIQFDGGRRMLFMSDYDGSWERYLLDFLGEGSVAVVPIWTHLVGCPSTRWLFQPTPGFGPRFLEFTRHDQVPVQLWYTAFADLSLANIRANAKLRAGLFAPNLSQEDCRAWVRAL